ncbi:MAG: hypothetical protein M5U26_10245 [Planctomycetota bacterium]|nr:hypothetical protein [Planctomycetota bacterium]
MWAKLGRVISASLNARAARAPWSVEDAMRTFVALGWSVVAILVAALPLGAEEPGGANARTYSLKFGWPESGKVKVVNEVLKKGNTSEQSYVLKWAPDEQNQHLVMEYTEFDLLAFNGARAPDPKFLRIKGMLEQSGMLTAFPKYQIEKTGEFKGALGLEELEEKVLAMVRQTRQMTDAEVEQVRATLKSPAIRSKFVEKVADPWNGWCGVWVGREIIPGKETASEFDGDGDKGVATFKGEGPVEDRGASCLRLTMRVERSGEVVKALVREMLKGAPAAELQDNDFPIEAMVTEIQGTYEIRTLRPLVVTMVRKMQPKDPNSDLAKLGLESHKYTFHWEDLPAPDTRIETLEK